MQRSEEYKSVSLFIVLLLALAIPSSAQAYRRRGSYSHSYSSVRARQQQFANQAANSQLNAAKQLLSVAEAKGGAAQSKLDAALSKLREEAQKFHEAQSVTRQAAKELAEIEHEILDEQASDSAYAKASKLVESVRNKLKQIEERILSEPSAQLEMSGQSGVKLSETRESILKSHADWVEAKTTLETEASALARIRTELFQADKHWKEAADALVQARKEESAAEQMTHSGASGMIGMHSTVKNASEAAAVARAAIAQAEGYLNRNGNRRNNQNTSMKSRNSPSPGKN